MDALEPRLRELLAAQPAGAFALGGDGGGKVTCAINGHTLPARFDAVSAFVNGAKYQKLLRRHQAESALKKYEPFIVQSANFPLMLYCALTGQLMDKSVEAVRQHMQGKKFQRAKERFTNDELELKPEPTLESFGVRLPKKGDAEDGGEGEGEDEEQDQEEAPAGVRRRAGAAKDGGGEGKGEGEGEAADGFWVPVGEEGGDGSGGEGDGSSGSLMDDDGGDDDDDDDDGPSASPPSAAAAAMEEDGGGAGRGAAANGKAAAAVPKQKHAKKQTQQKKHAANGAASAAAAATTKTKKANANKPSAAKRVKR